MKAWELLKRYFELLIEAPEGALDRSGIVLNPTERIPSIEAGVSYTAGLQALVLGDRLAVICLRPLTQRPAGKALKRIKSPPELLDPANIAALERACGKALRREGGCFAIVTEIHYVTEDSLKLHEHKLVKQIRPDMREQVIASLDDEFFHRGWWVRNLNEVTDGKVWGAVLGNGRVIGMTDSPAMPFMRDQVAEISYQVHKKYRGHGLARAMVSHACAFHLEQGRTPYAAVAASNAASKLVIRAVGGRKFADVVSIRINLE